MRKAFNFYRSYYDVAKELSEKDRLLFLWALLEKQFDGKEPKLKGVSNFAYISQKHSIDSQVLGYEKKTKTKLYPTEPPTEPPSVPPSVQEEGKEEGKEKEKEEISDIEKRKLKFASTLKPYLSKYGKDLLNQFYAHWTEPNKSNTKFRQELEKVWDLSKRLSTWSRNDKGFNKKQTPSNNDTGLL